MLNLYLVRHGQTEWNLDKRFQGSLDSPLTELGKEKARSLGDVLRRIKWDAIYASPLCRAHHTAEIIRGNGQQLIILKDDLKEMCFGDWEGRQYEEVGKKEPHRMEAFLQTPDTYRSTTGEDYYEVEKRALCVLKEIVEKYPAGDVLIVSHSIVVKLIMLHLEQRDIATLWHPPEIYPASLCQVTISEGQSEIFLYGDTSHY